MHTKQKRAIGSILLSLLLVVTIFVATACGSAATPPVENGNDVAGTVTEETGTGGETTETGTMTETGTTTGTGTETGTDNGTEQAVTQYAVTFVTDEHVTVTVFDTQDVTGTGTRTAVAYARNGETGEITVDGSGQVNFVLTFDEGYEIASLEDSPSANRKNVKVDPEGTGNTDVYRITKITGDLTVTIESKEAAVDEDLTQGYEVTFLTDGHATVTVYRTQDLTEEGAETDVAYSRDSATGLLTKSDGQVNFVVTAEDGYEVVSVTVSPEGSYKNLKKDPEGDNENYYRITKIAGELTVTVTTQAK